MADTDFAKWLRVPRCQAQTGANSSTDYELWDCRLAAGHYGAHEAETPDGASWTDGTTEIDPLHMAEYERDEAIAREELLRARVDSLTAERDQLQRNFDRMADVVSCGGALDAMESRAEAAEAEVTWLREALGSMLEMHSRHDRWCGYNRDAPGDNIVHRAPDKARAALATPPSEGS